MGLRYAIYLVEVVDPHDRQEITPSKASMPRAGYKLDLAEGGQNFALVKYILVLKTKIMMALGDQIEKQSDISVAFLVRRTWNIFQGNRSSQEAQARVVSVGIVPDPRGQDNAVSTAKYTLLTFIPKNLFEQFRRVANFYFLIVAIISLLIDSPVSPLTSIIPLIFVVAVSAVKQAYEDVLRHRNDRTVNNELVEVISNSAVSWVPARVLCAGALVRVARGRRVPADLVIIASSDAGGKARFNTANLDGETNLKTLKVPSPLVGCTPDLLPKDILIECPPPIPDLYTFYGRININGQASVPLNTDNLMLRGSRLKNTEWAIGCAVYTGEETKMALNSRITSNKFSSCESAINGFLVMFIFVLLVEMVISLVLKRVLENARKEYEFYLGPSDSDNSVASILQDLFSFMLLYYYIIPISLYVTIEMYKFIGSFFITWDNDLKCKETGQSAVANTSDLTEELGQVEILFSDKTGTLTKNLMHFNMCSVNSHVYEERKGHLYDLSLFGEREGSFKPDLKLFFTILATCHTVQVGEDATSSSIKNITNNNIINFSRFIRKKSKMNTSVEEKEVVNVAPSQPLYQASSPDEKALVEAAARSGVTFLGDDGNFLVVQVDSEHTERFELLQTLEFTSERKRMSVILRDSGGKIWLFCKGAESSVFPLCNDNPLIEATNNHIHQFAVKGLRTLAVAYKEITQEDYTRATKTFTDLRSSLNRRTSFRELTARYRIMEEGLTLLGATGVEDKLQDEVADTLVMLREAGIIIWVLTGDKVETAINVAQSCGHIRDGDEKLFLIDVQSHDVANTQLDELDRAIAGHKNKPLTLVVDGQSLSLILDSDLSTQFANIALKCAAVLCCRLSPLQKAQIVRLVKSSPGRPITAAVGDGANDISMIQEAHVGIGIFGKEGRQAARASDYAFTQFSMLRKLLIVNGHWYYQRLATLVQYFFYKNLTFVNLMVLFQVTSLFSTQTIFDSMYLTTFNLFTTVHCLVLSITEQSRPRHILLSKPELYKKNRKNKLMSWAHFAGWCGLSVYHALVIYISMWLMWGFSVISQDGNTGDLWTFGCALYHCLVVVISLKLWLHARYQTLIFVASVILCILSLIALNAMYSYFDWGIDDNIIGTYTRLLSSPSFAFGSTLVAVMALLPDFCFKVFLNTYKKLQYKCEDSKTTDSFVETTSL